MIPKDDAASLIAGLEAASRRSRPFMIFGMVAIVAGFLALALYLDQQRRAAVALASEQTVAVRRVNVTLDAARAIAIEQRVRGVDQAAWRRLAGLLGVANDQLQDLKNAIVEPGPSADDPASHRASANQHEVSAPVTEAPKGVTVVKPAAVDPADRIPKPVVADPTAKPVAADSADRVPKPAAADSTDGSPQPAAADSTGGNPKPISTAAPNFLRPRAPYSISLIVNISSESQRPAAEQLIRNLSAHPLQGISIQSAKVEKATGMDGNWVASNSGTVDDVTAWVNDQLISPRLAAHRGLPFASARLYWITFKPGPIEVKKPSPK